MPIATVLQAVAPKTFGDLAKTFASGDSGVVAISGETSPLIRHRGEYAPFVPVYALGENDFPVSLADAETDIQVTHLATNLPSMPISKYASQHATTTFLIEGISRSCTHQLVRHRRGSYSQESQRYVDLDKGKWNFIMPPSIRTNDRAASLYDAYLEDLGSTYRNLREAGVRKEDARFILPNAAETRLVVTMPHDAWEHFVWLRALDKAAQWEIRTLGQIVLTHLNHIHPLAFAKAWEIYVEKFRNS
jgi:thymidylate synthase (FAD)